MNRLLFLLLLQLLFAEKVSAQVVFDSTAIAQSGSVAQKDTAIKRISLPVLQRVDSFSKRPRKDANPVTIRWQMDPATTFSVQDIRRQILQRHPYFGFTTETLNTRSGVKQFVGKEALFYALVALLLVFALLRRAFPKYFNDLFRLFFRTTLKQRQISEQLIQTPLPSILLNGFFVVSGGLYLAFILQHFELNPVDNLWLMVLYCAMGLSVVYFIKFIGLKISGWLFNMQEAANSYIFIVFIINKILGILLLPFLVLLAFTQDHLYFVALTLSWCGIGCLLFYRFILTYTAIRNQVKVNPFHFFLYLCAFEIAPLLLVYKGLLLFLRITA